MFETQVSFTGPQLTGAQAYSIHVCLERGRIVLEKRVAGIAYDTDCGQEICMEFTLEFRSSFANMFLCRDSAGPDHTM
jgi:hypothetical protein